MLYLPCLGHIAWLRRLLWEEEIHFLYYTVHARIEVMTQTVASLPREDADGHCRAHPCLGCFVLDEQSSLEETHRERGQDC